MGFVEVVRVDVPGAVVGEGREDWLEKRLLFDARGHGFIPPHAGTAVKGQSGRRGAPEKSP